MAATTTELNKAIWESYSAAWDSRNVEAIMELHTVDTEFQLHDGRPRAVGKDAVRAEFATLFQTFPDLEFEEVRFVMASDLATLEYRASAALLGTERRMVVDVVDVFELRRARVAQGHLRGYRHAPGGPANLTTPVLELT